VHPVLDDLGLGHHLEPDPRADAVGVHLAIDHVADHREGAQRDRGETPNGALRAMLAGLKQRIRLQVARAEELPFPDGAFDAVSFTYLLRYVRDPAATLRELVRVLRPGGTLASLDFFVPGPSPWRAAWWLYTRTVLPPAGLALGGPEWWRVGRFLGPNISSFYSTWPLARIMEAWEAAGMAGVQSKPMSVGGGVVMWGRKRAVGRVP